MTKDSNVVLTELRTRDGKLARSIVYGGGGGGSIRTSFAQT